MNTSTPPPITSSRWGARTKRVVILFTLVFLGFVLWNVVDILPLIIVAVLLAYILSPIVNIFERIVFGFLPFRARALAVLTTFVSVLSVFTMASLVIIPVLINQLTDVGRNIPQFVAALEAQLNRVLSQPIEFGGVPVTIGGEPLIPLDRLREATGTSEGEGIELLSAGTFDVVQIFETFVSSLGGLTGPAFSVLGGALDVMFNLIFLIVIMFYLMRDGEVFTGHIVNITPDSYKGDVRRLLYELGRVWNAYLRGQLVLCVVIGVVVYLAALILGLPNAPVLGLLAGVLEFIPNLGPFVALLPAMFIALVSESSTIPALSGVPFAITVIIVWTGIQQIESIILVPRIMGENLDLHPLAVIIAVIAGASIAGAFGIILAAPFMASARLIGQYLYGKVFDVEPFPAPVREKLPPPPPPRVLTRPKNARPALNLTGLLPEALSRRWRDRPDDDETSTKQNSPNMEQEAAYE